MPRHATRTSFKKGNPGKPKGAVCKFTTLKQAFLDAFVEIGGKDALVNFYKEKNPSNKRALFQMIANMLPKDVHLEHSGGIQLTKEEIDARVARVKGHLTTD